MSWNNYLYNEKLNIAINIHKIEALNIQEDLENPFDEFIRYMNREEKSLEVIQYLWEDICIDDSLELFVSLFVDIYGDWNIIPENKLPKETKTIERI